MGRLTHTVSGSIATVRSPAVAPIESLKVHFSPIQEGTGDPSPSNVRPITGWTGITGYHTGINVFNQEDLLNGYIYAGGGSSSLVENDYFVSTPKIYCANKAVVLVNFKEIPNVSVKLRCKLFSGSSVYTSEYSASNNGDGRTCSGAVLNPSLNVEYIAFSFFTYNNDDLKEKIEDVCVTLYDKMPSDMFYDYIPYVEETLSVTFPSVGKNLFNKNAEPYQTGKYINDSISGIPQYSNSSNYNVYKIPIKPATTYTFGPIKGGSSGSGPIWATMNANGITTRYTFNAGGSEGKYHTFTSYSSDVYLLLSVAVTNDYGYKCDDILQVEEGSSATEYEAFDNTVYGGYIDLATGNIVATYKSIIFDGSEDEAWNNEYGDNYYIKLEDSKVNDTNYCNVAKYLPAASQLAVGGCKITQTLNFNIQIGNVIGINYDVPGFRNWLNQNNIQLVYALGNSKIIATLTPQELATFKGYSNFWSNAGDVDVTYQVVESSEMTKERQKIFTGNAPTIHTASGSVANFEMEPGLNRNLKSCKVGFLPVQEGSGDPFPPINQNGSIVGVNNTHNESELSSFKIHFSTIQSGSGDPSPTNIRPITGWTGVTGYKGGKNLYSAGDQSFERMKKVSLGRTFSPGTYTLSLEATSTDTDDSKCDVYLFYGETSSGKSKGFSRDTRDSWTFTIDRVFDSLWMYAAQTWLASEGDTVTFSNIQLEVGSTATSYEAYSAPTSYPVSWESQGTVYGGYVDLVSGDVYKTHEIVDLGTLNYVYDSTAEQFVCYSGITFGDRNSFVCSNYKTQSVVTYWTEMVDKTISGHSTDHSVFRIKDTDYTDAAAFKAAMDGVKLAYELITPVKVGTISPTSISLINGAVHSFWSDADAVTVETVGNVRPIKGWGKLNAIRCGKNLYPFPTSSAGPYTYWVNGSYPGFDTSEISSITEKALNNESVTFSTYFDSTNSNGNNRTAVKIWARNKDDSAWSILGVEGNDIIAGTSGRSSKNITFGDHASITFGMSMAIGSVGSNPMVEYGSSLSDYEPYNGNIYPITFPVQGKNLLDVSKITHNSYNIGSIPNILEPNTTYTFSVNGDTNKTYRLYAAMENYNTSTGYGMSLNSSYINKTTNLSFRTFTTPSNIKDYPYLALAGIDNTSGTVSIEDIKPQVELGSTATSYEPYDNSIFGGYVNLVTGEVWKIYDVIDLGSTNWEYYKYGNYNGGYNILFQNTLKKYKGEEIPNAYCTHLFMHNDNSFDIADHNITINIFGMIKVTYDEATSSGHLKSLLSGVLLVAELATPVLVTTLTPTQIQALKGTNNILSDANGIIEVKYWSH